VSSLRRVVARRARALAAHTASSSGYPARGGDSTHESPRTSHPLIDDCAATRLLRRTATRLLPLRRNAPLLTAPPCSTRAE